MDAVQRALDLFSTFSRADACAAHLLCDRHDPSALAFRFVPLAGPVVELRYGDLSARSRRVASGLRALGVRPGDRVATVAGKSEHLPALLLGIWRCGAVYVPIFTAFSPDLVRERLDDAGVRVVIVDADNANKVEGTAATVVAPDPTTVQVPWSALLDAPDDGVPAHITGGDGPLVHMFTSGTTGRPKGVVHSLAYCAGWQAYAEFALAIPRDGVFWCAADPGWAYGLYVSFVGPLACGIATTSAEGGFDAVRTWRILADLTVTDFAAAPTIYRALRATAPDLTTIALQRASSAGEPLTPEVNEWTRSALGIEVHDHFGQTELGMVLGFAHDPVVGAPVHERAMGRALPGWEATVLAVDADVPAPAGEVGRLAIAADSILMTFSGYLGSTADRFTADRAWYLTGDLASCDDGGVFHFSSRDDDVIIMAGYRIGPGDIEAVLAQHPAIVECAVVAAADPLRGEVIEAHVVLVTGVEADDQLTVELQQLVRTRYAAHAYPRRIHYPAQLPKTPSGKIKRSDLRAGVSA
jgi:acetyl-CoA synthetase